MALSLFLFGVGFGILVTGWRLHRQQSDEDARRQQADAQIARRLAALADLVLEVRNGDVRISGTAAARFLGPQDANGLIPLATLCHAEDVLRIAAAAAGDTEETVSRLPLLDPFGDVVWTDGVWLGTVAGGHRRLVLRVAAEAKTSIEPEAEAPIEASPALTPNLRDGLGAIIDRIEALLASPPASTDLSAQLRVLCDEARAFAVACSPLVPMTAPPPVPAALALALFIDECVAAVEPAASGRQVRIKVSLEPDVPTLVLANETDLRRILLPALDAAVARSAAGDLTLAIRPTSAGRVLFDLRFEDTDPIGDCGVSAARVAELGGKSGYDAPGRWWFDLALQPAAVEMAPPRAPMRVARPLKILLLEDDATHRARVEDLLAARGHQVDIVPEGGEAVMALQHYAYDLVLMDVVMSGTDGLTTIQSIRNLGSTARFTPVVAMVVAILRDQIQAIRTAGIDAVLPKPLAPDTLDVLLSRAARDHVRGPGDPGVYDAAIAARLAASIGAGKVVDMQKLLARTLCARFTSTVRDDTISLLKADAHACIPGAAMLGFTRLATRCRTFIDATDFDALEAAYAAVRDDVYNAVRMIDVIVDREETQVA